MKDIDASVDRTGTWLLLGCLVVTAAWWALALAPVADPPAWLAAAREVCFGSTPSGLPDTYGWLLLIAAPGSMLAGILVTWGRDVAADVARAWSHGWGRASVVAVAALVLAGSVWATSLISGGLAIAAIRYEPENLGVLPDSYPRLGQAPPAFRLVDQHGDVLTADDLRGQPTLLTFAFAHCSTVCPVIVTTIRRAAERMADPAPRVLVVTLDPWRDTPSRLPQMHRDWQLPAEARVLSGEVDDVIAALDGFRVPWQRNEMDGDVVHPPLVYVLDTEGRIAYGFNNPPVDWLVAAVARLDADAASLRAAR